MTQITVDDMTALAASIRRRAEGFWEADDPNRIYTALALDAVADAIDDRASAAAKGAGE